MSCAGYHKKGKPGSLCSHCFWALGKNHDCHYPFRTQRNPPIKIYACPDFIETPTPSFPLEPEEVSDFKKKLQKIFWENQRANKKSNSNSHSQH